MQARWSFGEDLMGSWSGVELTGLLEEKND
jgi:hypothetical protein